MDTSSRWLAALRAAIADDDEPGHRVAHAAVRALLDRVDRATMPGWARFPEAAAAVIGGAAWPLTPGVTANMIAIAGVAEPADLVALDRLIGQYGHRAVAAVHASADRLLGTGPALPVATRFVRAVARRPASVEALVGAGIGRERAVGIAERCARSGFWLLLADVEPDLREPELTRVSEVVRCVDSGGIRDWRAQVGIVAANPWSPYAADLARLLTDAGRPVHAQAVEEAVAHYRAGVERRDRALVAREVRRLVAMSGLSQRQFAARCGTSAPRLSTYVNGLVTPSASMMVRFRRVSEEAQREIRRSRGSSA